MSSADGAPQDFVWGPTIDTVACNDCGVCLDFCKNGVYERADGHVVVVRRGSCMAGCSHCATLCEESALTFPSLEELRASRREH